MRPLLSLTLLALPAAAAAQAPSYSKQIQPLFARYCVECHNDKEPSGGLSLESHKALLEGGGRGAALVAGKPDASRLVRMIEGKLKPVMPPPKSRQPGKAELALVRAWVLAGARDDGAVARVRLPALSAKRRLAPPVAAVAYSGDGKRLAAGGRGEVHLFDGQTHSPLSTLAAGRDRVTAAAFAAKTSALAVAASTPGEAHEVRLWPGGKLAGPGAVAVKHDDVIHAVAFSPDGALLATASYDRLVKLYDVAKRQVVRALKDHSDSVYGLSFSPDGKLLASGGADRAVKVWDVATGARLYTLGESTDWVYAVAWSPDGKHLAAAGVDRSIRVWAVDKEGGRVAHSVFAHEGPVTRLAYSADGAALYSLCEDGGAKAWDAARMVERKVFDRQPETPLSLAVRPDQKALAIGRFDGKLVVLDPATGKVLAEPLPRKPAAPAGVMIRPAALVAGRATAVTITGRHLAGAKVSAAGVVVKVTGANEGAVVATVTVPLAHAPGPLTLQIENEGGKASVNAVIDRFAAAAEAEPNDSPRTAQPITLPATLTGAVDRAGDLDWFRFEAKAGQEVGVQVMAGAVGSKLDPILKLIDPQGRVVAESTRGALGHVCRQAGTYAVGVRDREYRGGAGLHYRLHVGEVPVVTSVFPPGLKRGTSAEVAVEGVHLGDVGKVKVAAPATGATVPLAIATPRGPALGAPALAVGEYDELLAPGKAALAAPVTANGVVAGPGKSQTWRFNAKKGQRVVLEVQADRLGSPLDSVLDILDANGQPLPRAALRSLARTYVVFRDHDSRGSGIRIESWSELAVNDYLLVGSELLRIRALPRNPDDDCQFFSAQGQRVAYLGTSPVHQPNGTAMYKVAIHPPGTKFAANGLPVVTLYWRNDDGGPGLGRDSKLVFDPPADGVYQVRVGDSGGEGSKAHVYRLTLRPPRPDFDVSFTVAGAVSKGGSVPVRVSVRRSDEFDGLIDVKLLGVPQGLHAPATNVPPLDNGTAFALYAEADAKLPAKPGPMVIEARATIDGKEVVRRATGAWPRLIEPGDIVATTEQSEVTIRPGGEARITVNVERRNGFKGRIPVEVEGLPHGVRVLDVGLNGILITEAERRRTFVLYAEPWVQPMSHPIVVLSKREGRGIDYGAKSVLLKVAK